MLTNCSDFPILSIESFLSEEVLSILFIASIISKLPLALVIPLMTCDTLSELLEGNQRHVERDHVPTTPDDQAASSLVVSCSMAQQTPTQLWLIQLTDHVLEVSQLGNQVRKRVDSGPVLDANLVHLAQSQDIETIVIIGHTDCEIVAKAYDEYIAADQTMPAGIKPRIKSLIPIVRDAIESEEVAMDCPRERLLHRFVEYNVARQVEFLAANESISATVAGYVYDNDGVYRTFPDKPYLVSLEEKRDSEALRSHVPGDRDVAVASIFD